MAIVYCTGLAWYLLATLYRWRGGQFQGWNCLTLAQHLFSLLLSLGLLPAGLGAVPAVHLQGLTVQLLVEAEPGI